MFTKKKGAKTGKVPWRKHIERKKVFHIWGMITLRSIFKLFLMTFHVLQKEKKEAWRRKMRRKTTKKRLWHNNVMDLGSLLHSHGGGIFIHRISYSSVARAFNYATSCVCKDFICRTQFMRQVKLRIIMTLEKNSSVVLLWKAKWLNRRKNDTLLCFLQRLILQSSTESKPHGSGDF